MSRKRSPGDTRIQQVIQHPSTVFGGDRFLVNQGIKVGKSLQDLITLESCPKSNSNMHM